MTWCMKALPLSCCFVLQRPATGKQPEFSIWRSATTMWWTCCVVFILMLILMRTYILDRHRFSDGGGTTCSRCSMSSIALVSLLAVCVVEVRSLSTVKAVVCPSSFGPCGSSRLLLWSPTCRRLPPWAFWRSSPRTALLLYVLPLPFFLISTAEGFLQRFALCAVPHPRAFFGCRRVLLAFVTAFEATLDALEPYALQKVFAGWLFGICRCCLVVAMQSSAALAHFLHGAVVHAKRDPSQFAVAAGSWVQHVHACFTMLVAASFLGPNPASPTSCAVWKVAAGFVTAFEATLDALEPYALQKVLAGWLFGICRCCLAVAMQSSAALAHFLHGAVVHAKRDPSQFAVAAGSWVQHI